MSEFIKNSEYYESRQKELKNIIMKLHNGASVEEVREDFAMKFRDVSATEIAAMENALIMDGMPVENIQLLCDVHASVFKGSVREIHANDTVSAADHPAEVLKKENRLIESLISDKVLPSLNSFVSERNMGNTGKLIESLEELKSIDRHYARKEYLIFPVMERNDITAPPQVMWGVDDEIRAKIKKALVLLADNGSPTEEIREITTDVTNQINEMVFKEEEIMLPMIADVFTDKDWEGVSESSEEFGYLLAGPVRRWKSSKTPENRESEDEATVDAGDDRSIRFDAGSMTPEEINAILNTVPFDMTFVGADDKVKYFTQGKERIFDRPKTIIGREVRHCHPPKSVHVVEQIVSDLRSGRKDHEDFWISMGDRFVLIRYYAVRGK